MVELEKYINPYELFQQRPQNYIYSKLKTRGDVRSVTL